MTREETRFIDVVAAFKRRGFHFINKSDDGWLRFHGQLTPPEVGGPYPCEIQLDPRFLELPRIKLLDVPSQLPSVVPHLGGNGDLCYIAKGTVVLDIFDPVGQSLACLERATYVLGQILQGKMVEDLEEEFYAYWSGLHCLVDFRTNNFGEQECIVATAAGRSIWFVTDDEEGAIRKLNSFGWQATDYTVLSYRVRTTARPRPLTKSWPPRTISDILVWQGMLDPKCRRKILQRINEGFIGGAKGALILVESPVMTYGFGVLFEREEKRKRKPADRQKLIYGLEVIPMSVTRIDDRYMAERNIPGRKTLAGKNIAIVGCGTIGGFLSEMLAKAGAGTIGGRLTLVDFDNLYPQNVGRHRLGFPSLFANKAVAMAEELERLAPGVDVRPLPVNAMHAQLGRLDLLIDATGEEALGHWLCENYLPSAPMLSIWIEGPGIATRGLLRIGSENACYRCLWQNTRKGCLPTVVGSMPTLLAGHGCEGLYVPFPASASVQAASLGAEMALDWVNSVLSPSLRTRLIDTDYQLATPDFDPPRDLACPACHS